MQDTELYRQLLGLMTPWTVSEVKLSMATQQVDVWTEHAEGQAWPCPTCGRELALYDHSEERSWRHLDSCQFKTYLHARPPRVRCPEHGVLQVRLPWAEARSRFTALFERLAIDVLRETDVKGATRILRISWDEAWHILERAVARGMVAKQKAVVERIGVDEKAAAKGQTYLTLVCDLDRATIEYIGDGRKTESLDGYYRSLTEEQRQGIKAVAMDMWDAFIKSTKTHVEGAEDKIVFDRFHVMQDVGKAVNDVRKQEHRERREKGDETLAGSKYLWLYAEENLPEKHRERFDALRAIELKTGRAWAMKESLRGLWSYRSRAWAIRHWKRWYFWATHSRLKPMIEAARTIERHLHNVMTYFTHRITNAVSEGLNSKIQTIKKMAYGFRNREHFKAAIYFRCGGLQLYPATHAKPG
jgi:transposase